MVLSSDSFDALPLLSNVGVNTAEDGSGSFRNRGDGILVEESLETLVECTRGIFSPTSWRASQILQQREDSKSMSDKQEQSGVGCFGCECIFLDGGFVYIFFWDEEIFYLKTLVFPRLFCVSVLNVCSWLKDLLSISFGTKRFFT